MKKAALLVPAVLPLFLASACDENKYSKMLDAAAAVSVAIPLASSLPPNPLPAPPKKKEWKCSQAANVDFQGDTALEGEVRLKLTKKPGDSIAPSELANVKSINLMKYGPTDELNPCLFPKFTGLHDLYAAKGELEDLTPLTDLSQMDGTLRLTDNKIKNLTPIKKLVKLDRLDLSKTQVSDLEVVKGMTQLTELSLDNTSITDISALAALTKLERVSLANTAIKDVSPLKNCKGLKSLDISGTPVSDYSMLSSSKLKVKM